MLGASVESVFIEATHEETELRLLRSIRKFAGISLDAGLSDGLQQIRKHTETNRGVKKLIVIDQFEQWLHSRTFDENSELVRALRQCDGQNLQCLLLVRDDFWLALSRLMNAVEVPLRQNHNAALVDLFDPDHAQRVLLDFGIAYGKLPADFSELTESQKAFLDRSIAALRGGGKVFPVRLSLFVEMIKNQSWEVETIDRLGGIEGVGLRFLEESFSSELAPVAQRTHEPAVRGVLRVLLPEPNVDIKGNMQSEEALLEASGYGDDTTRFKEMIRILDKELRLISPTDPAGVSGGEDSISQSGDGVAYYQLTHDYLVPAIDRWISRRQRETGRGRAELRLSEYASVWASKPSAKYLPSWVDWMQIKLLSNSTRWTATESEMMRQATRRHLIRMSLIVGIFALVLFGGSYGWRIASARAVVRQLQTARTAELSQLLDEVSAQGKFSSGPLRRALSDSKPNSRERIVNLIGLLNQDSTVRRELIAQCADTDLGILLVARDRLESLSEKEFGDLVDTLSDPERSPEQHLRTTMLLAGTDQIRSSPLPASIAESVVSEMLRHASAVPQDNSFLIEGLRPIGDPLLPSLMKHVLEKENTPKRALGTGFAIQFLAEKPEQLFDLLTKVSLDQHPMILSELDDHLANLRDLLVSNAFAEIDSELPEHEHDRLARKKAIAASLLHRVGQGELTWALFRHDPKPYTRGYLINRVSAFEGDYLLLLSRFSRESDPSVRRGLLSAMGGFDWNDLSESARTQTQIVVRDTFKNDPDPGLHATAQWILLNTGDKEWVQNELERLSKLKPDPRKNWFVNQQGITMNIFDARDNPDIGRVFAIGSGEVTVDQALKLLPEHEYYEYRSPTGDCPIGLMTWFESVEYCRSLTENLGLDVNRCYPEHPMDSADYKEVLDASVYRLPTVAEWRFACAAGTVSRRYYGVSDELADDYFYYYETSRISELENRYFPPGAKRPNDFGMFNLYDGVREWAHTPADNQRRYIMGTSGTNERSRPETGANLPLDKNPADLPKSRNGFYGLRVALTITSQ